MGFCFESCVGLGNRESSSGVQNTYNLLLLYNTLNVCWIKKMYQATLSYETFSFFLFRDCF